MMIYSGATHNFISVELVRRWGLDVHEVASYRVILGTGLTVKGERVCKGVKLKLLELMVIKDFLPLELRSSDVILGLQWLETLGITYTNWKTKVMMFTVGTTRVELQGDPSLTKSQVALKAMAKALRQGGKGVLIEFNHIGVEKDPSAFEVPKDLERIVQQFWEVFEMPKGLPPV